MSEMTEWVDRHDKLLWHQTEWLDRHEKLLWDQAVFLIALAHTWRSNRVSHVSYLHLAATMRRRLAGFKAWRREARC